MALVVQFDFENNRKDTKVYSTSVMPAQKKLDINRCPPTTLLCKLAPRRPQQVPPQRVCVPTRLPFCRTADHPDGAALVRARHDSHGLWLHRFRTYGFLHTLVSHGIPLPVCGHEDALSPAGFLALRGLQLHVALHERHMGASADTGCGEAGAAAGSFCRGIAGLGLSAASLLGLHRRHRAWNMSVSFSVGKGRAARETETRQWDKVAPGWSVNEMVWSGYNASLVVALLCKDERKQ